MARHRVRLDGHPARPAASLLAASLCLAVGLLLLTAGTAKGISGYGSPGPAVGAQYPDAFAPVAQPGAPPPVSDLGEVMLATHAATHAADHDPKAAARLRRTEQQITRKARRAVLSSSGISTSQSGSIGLLLAAMAVLSIGGVLRWRRA